MSDVLISVIVPLYNSVPYIKKCVEHLCKQTIGNKLELVFVDDGSSDDSVDKVKYYLNEFHFRGSFKVMVHHENKGAAVARIDGIMAATGEYVIFCDSDDWMESDMCEKMLELAYKNGSDLVICDYVNDYSDKPSNKSSKCYISPYLHHLLLCRVTGSLCNKLVKRDIFFTPGFVFPQHSFCEDYVYSIQYAILCDTISYLPEAMYHYCHRKGSIVMADNEESINRRIYENLENYNNVILILKQSGLFSEFQNEIIALKLIIKNSILLYLPRKGYYAKWKKTFPELTFEILRCKEVSFRSKIKYFLTLSGVFPLYIYANNFLRCRK